MTGPSPAPVGDGPPPARRTSHGKGLHPPASSGRTDDAEYLLQTLVRPSTSARSLISEDEFAAVVATVVRDGADLNEARAERIVEEALKFVATCAVQDEGGLRPSRAVDAGWHALILHTRTYARLCDRLGRFVHHCPDTPALRTVPMDALRQRTTLHRTQALMVGAGYEPDPALWMQMANGVGDCTTSECEGGPTPCCSDCGPKN